MFKFVRSLASSLRNSTPTPRKQRSPYRQLRMEALDARMMFSVSPAYFAPEAVIYRPDVLAPPQPTQQEIDQQMGLPALNSLPGAPVTLYLDFNGNFMSSWTEDGNTHTNVRTPVWDMDGNASNFSTAEQAVIKEVWARVAEDYAPFNINVSTAYYGGFENRQALRVAVGGNNTDWLHGDASGVASLGSFHNDEPNIAFAFDMIAWARAGVDDGEGRVMNGAAALATTISHEAAHAFGLRHHSIYNADGTVANFYDPGSSNWTPIMGNNRASDRTTWAFLPTDQGPNVWQDDMAALAAANNGFGFRADDHGNTTATATALTRAGRVETINNAWGGSGVIHQANDKDYFKFTASAGTARIEVNAAQYGANLLPVLQLWSSSGLVASAGTVTPTRSIITANLTAGTTYYVLVKSVGFYGDVGQYTVSVSTVMTNQMASQANMSSSMMYVMAEPAPTKTTTLMDGSTSGKSYSAGHGQGVTPAGATSPQTVLVTQDAASIGKSSKLETAPPIDGVLRTVLAKPLNAAVTDAVFRLKGK